MFGIFRYAARTDQDMRSAVSLIGNSVRARHTFPLRTANPGVAPHLTYRGETWTTFWGRRKVRRRISEAIVSALGFASRCWVSWRWPYSAAQLNVLLIWEMIQTTVQKWISFSFLGLVGTPHKVAKLWGLYRDFRRYGIWSDR